MFDRRLIQYFDWVLLGLTLLLCGIGVLMVYSAVMAGAPTPQRLLYLKQIVWFSIGLLVMVASFLFNYKQLEKWATPIYLVSLLLLLAVLLFGRYIGGARRWLILGPISIQPSEPAKIAVIIMLARYYSKHATDRGFTLRGLLPAALIVALPFALIVREPDLGTAMLLVLIAGVITLYVKIERRTLIFLISSCLVGIPLVWSHLKEYQKLRIWTFLNPERDPLGAGYHITQSKIAIGSGMLSGKGFLKGSQNALSFLPEQHTDFIFSVLAEQWGFVGAGLLLLLFLILIVWGVSIAFRCRDPFGVILCVGVVAMIAWQVVINIGMVMGLMPVVGVPLPFISYGGSSMITAMIGIGLLLNVSMRRFIFE